MALPAANAPAQQHVVSNSTAADSASLQSTRRHNAARGELTYECVEGKTAATRVYATYPLKFLHPRGAVRQGYDTFITVRTHVCVHCSRR